MYFAKIDLQVARRFRWAPERGVPARLIGRDGHRLRAAGRRIGGVLGVSVPTVAMTVRCAAVALDAGSLA